jgi:serine/threonine-protein kinase
MPAENTDRNLLFGVLALQTDFLDAAQFAEACSAWARRKDTPLADLLVERGLLTARQRNLVDLLLQEKLQKHGGDAHASLRRALTAPDVRGVLESVADDDVRQSLSGLPTPSTAQPSTAAYQMDTLPAPPSMANYEADARRRYTLTRLHARGGIGQVWLARDEDLGRDVALKELRPDRGDSPAASARFLEEAKITGQLEHPGIVPVYELVRPREGRPCYAMRFVRGRTLTDTIQNYHRRLQASESGPLDLRQLLTAFVGVCNAVGYAHSRGVLHRDLKPHNVVLGDFGEVVVLDWGLAKLVGRPEEQGGLLPVSVGRADGRDRDKTQEGEVLGTPAYMAPEQAEGRPDRVGPWSDVYGLGAVLYEVLTGVPPFGGSDTPGVLGKVPREPIVTPCQRVAATPPALQAVCLKALAKDPGDRYQSPREMARDVERFLADEPVPVYREPPMQRLARWGRRHRTVVVGLGVLMVTAVVGLTAGLLAVNAERRRTEEARAEEARRRQQARGALDAMSSQVIEDWLARQSELTDPQKRFLEQALTSYEEFARDTGRDEETRAGVARASQRVGQIRFKLGQLAEARDAFARGRDLMARLAAEAPARPEYRLALAGLHNNLGTLAWTAGQSREAESSFREAAAVYRRLADDFPSTPEYREGLARAIDNLGYPLRDLGRRGEAEEAHRDAIAVRRRLAADFPAVPAYRRAVARSLNNLGNLLKDPRSFPEAEKAYQEAIDLQRQLTVEEPQKAENRHDQATSYVNLGVLFQLTKRPQEAEGAYRKALALHERLAADFPTKPVYREDLAVNHFNLANLLTQAGRNRDAEPGFAAAIAVQQRLVADFPGVPGYRRALARTQANHGELLLTMKRSGEAEQPLSAARAALEKLVADSPAHADYHHELGEVLTLVAMLRRDRGELADALRTLDEARSHHQSALRADPRHVSYRGGLRTCQSTRVDVLLRQGDHASAVALAGQVLQDVGGTATDAYDAACWLARCVPLGQKDVRLPEADRQEVAKEYADRAMAALRQAVSRGYKDVAHMKKDGDLDPLRPREDFRELLAELEQKK